LKSSLANVVILAAGKGTRMKSALPKVLHTLAGRPLLAHVLASARALNAERVVVVDGHGSESVRKAFASDDIVFVTQEPQLGTGHAVQQAAPHLLPHGNTLILYGDVPLTSVTTLARVVDTKGLRILTADLPDPTGYGRIVRDNDGRITAIVEHKDANKTQLALLEINSGILCAPTASLKKWLARLTNNNAQREYYLTDIVSMALADGVPVDATQPDSPWEIHGINSRDQLAYLERVHQLESARRLMSDGVMLADPWRFDVRGELTCGQDVSIDVNCVFEGTVRLADNVQVQSHCVLKDVTVGRGTVIAPFSHLDNVQAGENCRIGPYARLRPGTQLANETHVGNFVEIKNASLDERSKANHLAYLGDATIGKDVNIGAGTITCNYDGANKHRTIIEDNAFIGSDSQLVAPVTVGRGATIGAGSTVTKDAPADSLTVSRAKQVSIAGWARPVKNKPGSK
jgi:bifunctional UDP-N-acetylglucosamine pyrophosphorylase/glucosamine-1-phosphate N-acetyltransferase